MNPLAAARGAVLDFAAKLAQIALLGNVPPVRAGRRGAWSFAAALALDPRRRAASGGGASGERGLQEIAPRRRLPVDHFAGGENARQLFQHEGVVDLAPCDAAGAGNGARDRRGREEAQRQSLDARRERFRLAGNFARFAQQRDRGRREAGGLA